MRRNFGHYIVLALIFGGCAWLLWANEQGGLKNDTTISSKQTKPASFSKEEILRAYELKKLDNLGNFLIIIGSYEKNNYGEVQLKNITIKTFDSFDAKDIEIVCTSFGASGTVLNTNKSKIYKKFIAGTTQVIKTLDMGYVNRQSDRVRCDISDFEYDLETMKDKAIRSHQRGASTSR